MTHALASSDVPRATSFRGPLLGSGTMVVALTTAVGVLIGASLVSTGHSTPSDAGLFVLASTCVGVISSIAWLAGQAMPRAAALISPVVFALGAVTSTVPEMQPFTPWGWVGLAYPVAAATGTLAPILAVTATAAAAAPALMSRLSITLLAAQAARWAAATSYATGMELAAAATVYQAAPKVGRHLRAVRPALPSPVVFLLRDAVGAARTPVRLAAAALALAAAAALFTLSLVPEWPDWALGAVAGVILFAGLGPFTDGIRHAASVASDLPLYGISDARLLTYHTLFPVFATIATLVVTTAACALLIGHAIPAILGSLALGILAVIARIGNALKGPLPPALLSPIPTPMGDLGAAARLTWAMDGVLLTALAGASAALVLQSPVLLLAVGIALTSLTIRRWRHRA
ncbi:hypothetical protein [Microbacterium lushaniae]|uniref:hypothetical protein n=1 Tax=Microbacterium lushaniae TaxID=2614639 RepID=UPI001EE951C3|nr:hypothetical protein [Microbacterium lushaniae]